MKVAAERLRSLLERIPDQLAAITEVESANVHAPGKWSKKQILGHLIDSAANNHQRFVRAQLSTPLSFPGYAQNDWVAAQQYQSESWSALVRLWTSYNTHLLHVISNIPEEKWKHQCKIGEGEPVTLAFLAEDYVRHAEHHLAQILIAKSDAAAGT